MDFFKFFFFILIYQVNSNVIVRVDHNPIFWSHFRRKSIPGLAIDISSINISETGISWLQYTLQGQTVYFTLLKKYPDRISCIVFLNVFIFQIY